MESLRKMVNQAEKSIKGLTTKDLVKFFVHGIAFNVLLFVSAIVWAFTTLVFVGAGFVIGFVIGLVLLFLIVGLLNTLITSYLWFKVRFGFWEILFHGTTLFIAWLIIGIVLIIVPNLVFPGTTTYLVAFIVAAFPQGFIAKKIAKWWTPQGTLAMRVQRAGNKRLVLGAIKNLLAIVLELGIIFPIVWIFSASIRTYGSLLTTTLQIIPSNPTPVAYYWALALDSPFWSALVNSLVVCLFTTGLCIAVASPAGYALSRFRFLGKKPILYALIFIQFVPGILMFIAFFWLLFVFGLYDNLIGLILIYVALVLPFSIWNLKAFFDTIPRDIDEAALIDGATYAGAMFHVVLPLSTPGLAVTAFFSFLTGWNEFALANIVLGSESNYTLPLRLYALSTREFETNWPHFAALSILSSIPIVIVFLFLQRYLRAGLAIGAVKG